MIAIIKHNVFRRPFPIPMLRERQLNYLRVISDAPVMNHYEKAYCPKVGMASVCDNLLEMYSKIEISVDRPSE